MSHIDDARVRMADETDSVAMIRLVVINVRTDRYRNETKRGSDSRKPFSAKHFYGLVLKGLHGIHDIHALVDEKNGRNTVYIIPRQNGLRKRRTSQNFAVLVERYVQSAISSASRW